MPIRSPILIAIIVAIATAAAAAITTADKSASWLFLQLDTQATAESNAAAKAGDPQDAKTWAAWARLYRQLAVAPNNEGKSALQMTDELERSNVAAGRAAKDPRAIALYRASVRLWHSLHLQLAAGQPLAIAFPKREMLTPVPGLTGTPWQAGVNATAADCAALAQRVRFCRAQIAQMQHENVTGLYGDRSMPLLMQEHSCHKWEEMQVAYCMGR